MEADHYLLITLFYVRGKKQKKNFNEKFEHYDSMVSLSLKSHTTLCQRHRGIMLHGVIDTAESDSAKTLQRQQRIKLNSVLEIRIYSPHNSKLVYAMLHGLNYFLFFSRFEDIS